ncbi:MAG: 50S ribosomal protein L15e, partial [Desulfurococcaceae archaeon]
MAKSMYHYVSETWHRMFKGEPGYRELLRLKLIKWRREPSVVRIDKPSRLDRARALGYKAKVGFIVVRVRVRKGGQ